MEKLITTINSQTGRISMHGVRNELLKSQAQKIGLPLEMIPLEGNVSMATYNEIMQKQNEKLISEGLLYSIFGDIHLEDLRKYREEQLEKAGITAVFPLWKKDTKELMHEFLSEGFKALVVCVNSKQLDRSFCGRELDLDFLSSLPEGVDPCGENGEFHTFVYDGPIFKEPVKFQIGEVVEKFYKTNEEDDCFKDKTQSWDTAFWYCDLIPE